MVLRRACTLVAVGWLSAGCVLELQSSSTKKSDAGAATPSTQADPFECAAAKSASRADVEALVKEALAELTVDGGPVGTEVWDDAQLFAEVVRRTYEKAGCALPAGEASQALESGDPPTYYCGPGFGPAGVTHPPVNDCVNAACRAHDACYASCDKHIGLTCCFSDPTHPCDDPFLARVAACPDDGSHTFGSAVVLATATLLSAVEIIPCKTKATCPELGQSGTGSCAKSRDRGDCKDCLAALDRDGKCHDAACADEPDSDECYAANCPKVAQCFGGYGLGRPVAIPGAGGGAQGVPPGSLWNLEVVGASLPETAPDGSAWDVEWFGWGPPDAKVVVQLGDLTAYTSEQGDNLTPSWEEQVITQLTPADLQQGASFTVWDMDVSDHDLIGTCQWTPTEADYLLPYVALSCDPADLWLYVRLVPQP